MEVSDSKKCFTASLQNKSLCSIDLYYQPLTDKDVKWIADTLKTSTYLQRLNLVKTGLGETGAREVAQSLRSNSWLQHLDLTKNDVGDGGAHELAQALESNVSLQSMILSNNKISDTGVADLAEALMVNTTLHTLGLHQVLTESNNSLGENGARALGRMLSINTSLQCLRLCRPRKGNEDIFSQCICEALVCNTSLKELHIGYRSLVVQHAKSLAQGLKANNVLQKFDVQSRHIEPGVGQELAQLLMTNTSLQDLRLWGSGMLETDVNAIGKALSFNTSLHRLYFSCTFSDGSDYQAMGKLLRNNATLRYLFFVATFEGRSHEDMNTMSLLMGEALRDAPRYHELIIRSEFQPESVANCYDRLKSCVNALGLPNEARHWTDDQIAAYYRKLHVQKACAFAMVQHPRLGAQSMLHVLSEDAVRMICEAYFGLPLGYLGARGAC